MNKKTEHFYYPYFDYLRIILASIVMFVHDGLFKWPHSGALAVDVFFALSGWLIGRILLNLSSKDLPRFYFNRAIRIWVPYFITFTFIVLASFLKKDVINAKWIEFVFYKFTFVYNIFGPPQLTEYRSYMPLEGTGNHFWSVNAEEQFYLLSPLLIVLVPKIGRTIVFWILLALTMWYLNIYAPISFGVLAAVINNKYPNFYSQSISKFCCLILLVASTLAMAVVSENYQLLSPIFSICLVLLLATKGEAHPIGKFLGGISYPLYLNHWMGFFLCNLILAPLGFKESSLQYVLSAVVNYGIASILYFSVDRKLIAKRNQLFTVFRGKIVIWIAYGMVLIGLLVGITLTAFPTLGR
jgi:peptidoglycan/LPS O-acetylase OafA/YrhL